MSSAAIADDTIRTIERHAEADTGAAIVAGDGELVEAERVHHLERVLADCTERIAGMVLAAIGFRAVAIAAHVDRNDREIARERRRDLVPADERQRIAVDQEKWRPVTSDRDVDLGTARLDAPTLEPFHQRL